MKNYLFILLISLSTTLHAGEDIHSLVHVQKLPDGQFRILSPEGDIIPAIPGNEEVRETILRMNASDDAVLTGHLQYQVSKSESTHVMKPYLVIDDLKFVSLKRLGQESRTHIPDKTFESREQIIYTPLTIPVTTEVASAMTMTAAFTMFDSLTSSDLEPSSQQDMRKALFLSAGITATLLFIYDQIQGTTKP